MGLPPGAAFCVWGPERKKAPLPRRGQRAQGAQSFCCQDISQKASSYREQATKISPRWASWASV